MEKINRSYICLLLTAVIFFYSCTSKFSKKHLVGVLRISDNLYTEVFQVYSGGALASDSYSNYLTDSVNFRIYVGTVYYDDEQLYCKSLDSNRILVYRAKRNNETDTLEKKIYLLSELKKEGKFD